MTTKQTIHCTLTVYTVSKVNFFNSSIPRNVDAALSSLGVWAAEQHALMKKYQAPLHRWFHDLVVYSTVKDPFNCTLFAGKAVNIIQLKGYETFVTAEFAKDFRIVVKVKRGAQSTIVVDQSQLHAPLCQFTEITIPPNTDARKVAETLRGEYPGVSVQLIGTSPDYKDGIPMI